MDNLQHAKTIGTVQLTVWRFTQYGGVIEYENSFELSINWEQNLSTLSDRVERVQLVSSLST